MVILTSAGNCTEHQFGCALGLSLRVELVQRTIALVCYKISYTNGVLTAITVSIRRTLIGQHTALVVIRKSTRCRSSRLVRRRHPGWKILWPATSHLGAYSTLPSCDNKENGQNWHGSQLDCISPMKSETKGLQFAKNGSPVGFPILTVHLCGQWRRSTDDRCFGWDMPKERSVAVADNYSPVANRARVAISQLVDAA